jgi:DNA repair protein RadC
MGASIGGPKDVLAELRDIRTKHSEHFVALYLDSRNRILHRQVVGIGGVRAAVTSPRDILAPALDFPTTGIVVAHNHPSGDPEPSAEDLEVTRQLAKGCATLGIELLDHLVVAKRGYVSLKELGAL